MNEAKVKKLLAQGPKGDEGIIQEYIQSDVQMGKETIHRHYQGSNAGAFQLVGQGSSSHFCIQRY